jgi:flagellum-specific peptidoglycan hydrolase FlgJ
MADFRLPGRGYDPSFNTLTVSSATLVELWGGAGPPDPFGDLSVQLRGDSVEATELEPNLAHGPNTRLFRIVGLKPGRTRLEARLKEDPDSTLYCNVNLIVSRPQHAFLRQLVPAINLAIVRREGIAPSVMLAQACLESGWGGRDPNTQKINPNARVVVHNTIFGITSQPGAHPWFTKCKTIRSPTTPSAGATQSKPDWFCIAGSYQEALEVYIQLLKDDPRTTRTKAMIAAPRYDWTNHDLLTFANLLHAEFNFGMGNSDYGNVVMNIVRNWQLTVYDPSEKFA